ncbi:carbon-nitrogen hydrolase family protein [Alisedimentitalea sp. MJ-SS2]|uniref:carbon-nitrogen hydrolase family protein n=1 Tax=Aliisedimentitalea sp. MJ-SS2 TaxID=3049795 RepID=UPI0029075FF2|nr:carbon-nitrogen hydrolase family protein [Alisedimentitalea sp. MJ-SS2]MDU8927884.1 carbon-nitrogen hydrolase family protein [Alisedimentitalea sp. MJ-SS2]
MTRAALIQMTSTDDPAENREVLRGYLHQVKAGGAGFALSPEVTNCISGSRSHQRAVLREQDRDETLAMVQEEAQALEIWVLIGSLGILTGDEDGRFANRSFLVSPQGKIAGQYDKIHMFDVNVSETETYRESAHYRPGDKAVLAETDFAKIGMTICYDVRFAALHRTLAQAGAQILTVPAAFSAVTGAAHWETLLRARAIETGCYVLAPAQTGVHYVKDGVERRTYGHSLAVAPWGEVLADAGEDCGVTFVDLDMEQVAKSRQRVPSLSHDRDYETP